MAVLALWGIVMAGATGAAGCYGHICDDTDPVVFGREPGEGHLLDPDTWESNPVDAVWLPFPRKRVWIFQYRALGDRNPDFVIPYISAEESPLRDSGNFTIGSGNLAELSSATKGQVVVKNDTCADYHIRLVVRVAARPPADAADAAPTAATPADAATD